MVGIIKDVLGYEGRYKISDDGVVYSHPRTTTKGGVLSPSPNGKGYLKVVLHKDGRRKTLNIHRLVATHFVKGYFDGAHVNHIDFDKTNNTSYNLEWVTADENNRHSRERLINSTAKHYTIETPKGEIRHIFNLSEFCREHKLDSSSMVKVAKGKLKHYKQYKCSYRS